MNVRSSCRPYCGSWTSGVISFPNTTSVSARPTITHYQLLQTASYLLNHTEQTKPFHLSSAHFQCAVSAKFYQQQALLIKELFLSCAFSVRLSKYLAKSKDWIFDAQKGCRKAGRISTAPWRLAMAHRHGTAHGWPWHTDMELMVPPTSQTEAQPGPAGLCAHRSPPGRPLPACSLTSGRKKGTSGWCYIQNGIKCKAEWELEN